MRSERDEQTAGRMMFGRPGAFDFGAYATGSRETKGFVVHRRAVKPPDKLKGSVCRLGRAAVRLLRLGISVAVVKLGRADRRTGANGSRWGDCGTVPAVDKKARRPRGARQGLQPWLA